MGAAGFAHKQTQDVWWINQVTSGVKPILGENTTIRDFVGQYARATDTTIDNNDLEDFGSPAFGIKA